ncbi:MAG: outer membrane beta-barrel protein [Candidatus Aminicenantes bacterium]|nr:outer membrane beta-barrel protein [Candidatus Aminicenantes bacterium]
MMKRLTGTIAVLLLVSSSAGAAAVRLEFKAGYFRPSDKDFLDIYGGGPRYGGEVSIGLWKGFDLWLGGNYFSREGELTFTKEKTELQIIPVGVGLKYRWTKGIIRVYTAAGMSSFQYKESNPIGEISKSRVGLTAEMGSYVKVAGGLLLDLYMNYSVSYIETADYKVNIGGLGAGVGLAYQF